MNITQRADDPVSSPPAFARGIYARLAQNLAVVRRRLGRPLTLGEKLLLGHLEDPETQELVPGRSYLSIRPDRVVLQDVLGQTAFLQFSQTRRERVAVPTSVHCDHLTQARDGAAADLARSLTENGEVYRFLRTAAARYGAGFWEPGAGIIHQIVLETYAFPGQLIVGTDSHTPNAGGLGACAVGVGGADAVEVMAGGAWEVLYPRRIAVFLTGKLGGWTAPKDVIAFVAGRLSVSGGTNAVLEYIGPGARTLSATGKATIANMGAEVGATTSVFPADASMSRYLEATGRGELVPLVEHDRHLFEPDPAVEADPERFYDQVIRLDLSTLEPHVVGPHSPDRARPISQLVAEIADATSGIQDAIDVALIGSCTNSSYEDISRAADVARQAIARGLVAKTELLVTPGSERVRATLERDGLLAPLEAASARVLASACGPCIGQWKREGASERSTIVTSFNRNFAGRNDGRATTMSFIASPEIVMALAFAGRLSFNPLVGELTAADGARFRLEPPAPAPDVPPSGFVQSGPNYVAPPADGGSIAIAIDPKSERLQELAPWPEWDGADFVDLPVLIKARGKTTTDAISPAGPWLRFRGHLDRFSDNLLSGAADADTGEVGTTLNRFTGRRGPVASVARDYRARGLRWVIVADANYGEGSSREHAALSPRLLGGVAVIARSFARIHESNLKKQGLLALTFEDPADYDRIGGRDTMCLVGLSELAPGRKVLCRVTHPDGSSVELRLVHSYSHSQLEWFRAGSALAVLRGATSIARRGAN